MEAIGEVAMDVVEERMEGNEVNGTGSSFQVLNTSAEEDSNAVNCFQCTHVPYYVLIVSKVCAVCLELDETDDNLIVFCDKCSVPVHQYCYGVAVIPEGPWYCNVCAIEGMDVASTLCDLCLQPSGALKPTTVPHRWVHLKCATWIPEVYCMDCSVMEPYNLERVDRNRFRLKCGVCKKVKGACIQCSYGRCQHSG